MTKKYDAIIVGARCSGSPLAMLLARQGFRVLLVDRASFPSDTLSTLAIHPPGVAALARWGLLEQIKATGCPPLERYLFDFAGTKVGGIPRPYDGISTAYAPRRTVLDKILIDAAASAGAEVRERFTVDEVIFEDGVVIGIRGHSRGGESVVERADVVIGADGRNSRVAKAVHAAPYMQKPVLQVGYYTYWRGLDTNAFEMFSRPDRAMGAIPTNDGLSLVVVGWPIKERNEFRSDIEGNYLKTLELAPEFAERVRSATRVAPFTGGGVENFLRKPYGPGWALVGDAGYSRDPLTARGISDAFRDAELCAAALNEVFCEARSFNDAMSAYHQTRDQQSVPLYQLATDLGTLEQAPPPFWEMLAGFSGDSTVLDALGSLVSSVVAGTIPPVDLRDAAQIRQALSTTFGLDASRVAGSGLGSQTTPSTAAAIG